MAKYNIKCEQSIDIPQYRVVTANGKSTVELSDEEVATLVKLIREKSTTSIDELGIATFHPELYAKLDEAYGNMARKTEYMFWLWECFEDDDFGYDRKELIDYCERECGFNFEHNKDDNLDEEELYETKYEAFLEWLDKYVRSMSDDDAARFMCEHMDADIEVEDVEYKVDIPEDIIRKAKEQD